MVQLYVLLRNILLLLIRRVIHQNIPVTQQLLVIRSLLMTKVPLLGRMIGLLPMASERMLTRFQEM